MSAVAQLEKSALLVAVVPPGADAAKPGLPASLEIVAYDPVSRLIFLKSLSSVAAPSAFEWLPEAGKNATDTVLFAPASTGMIRCHSKGWIKQVRGKILPLALLQIDFSTSPPPSGTPLRDQSNRIVAIVFQENGSENSVYALPAEAVHRVYRDISVSGRFVRAWIGLTLQAETPSPQVYRVLPNSPAAAAGIQPGDVLQKIGNQQVSEYADAVNAFFYLIPGQPVQIHLLRENVPMELTLTPSRQKE